MSIERTFYCDGLDCERHVSTTGTQPPTFLTVAEEDDQVLHFCGWDCVLKFAAKKPPEEVIPAAADD